MILHHTCRLRFITLYNLIIYSVRYCKHVYGSSTKKYLFESNLIWWWGSQALMNFGIVVKQRNIVSCLTLQTVPHFEIKLASSPLRRRISAANVKQRQHTQNRLAGNLVCLSTAQSRHVNLFMLWRYSRFIRSFETLFVANSHTAESAIGKLCIHTVQQYGSSDNNMPCV